MEASEHARRKIGIKLVGAGAVLCAGLGVTIALAGPASAHTNAMNAPTVVCDTATKTYTITYTGQGDYNLDSVVTVTSSSPGATTITPTTQNAAPVKTVAGGYADPFAVVQTGVPGSATSASVTVEEVWSDKVTATATSPTVVLNGDCAGNSSGSPSPSGSTSSSPSGSTSPSTSGSTSPSGSTSSSPSGSTSPSTSNSTSSSPTDGSTSPSIITQPSGSTDGSPTSSTSTSIVTEPSSSGSSPSGLAFTGTAAPIGLALGLAGAALLIGGIITIGGTRRRGKHT